MAAQCFWQSEVEPGRPTRQIAQALRVLVVDDQSSVRFALEVLLRGAGHQAVTANGPAEAIAALAREQFDAVVLDLNYTRDTTAGSEGLELVTQIRQLDRELPIVVMTAWGTVELAVEALHRGAQDFIQKPWQNQQLLEKLARMVTPRAEETAEKCERQDAIAIQRRLNTFETPEIPGCEISGLSRSLRYIGGDSAQVFPLGPSRFAVSIADVAGKLLPGALLAANLRGAEKSLLAAGTTTSDLCRALNQSVREVTTPGKFVSFFCGVVDAERRTLRFTNAGHNPPLVVGRDGNVRTLAAGGAVLGIFEDWPYTDEEIALNPGDRIVLFTDGIVEAFHEERGEFGNERLAQVAAGASPLSADAMRGVLMQAVSRHCDGKFQDDCTLVVIAFD